MSAAGSGRLTEPRLLVAIAHHGTKNARHLERVIAGYREMDWPVHIVVITDRPRQVPGADEVLVGAPTRDPWSLPFRHRELFGQRHSEFDLFLYSEDDILVTARHVQRFIELSKVLPSDRILGFLLYEVTPEGRRSYCDFHSGFRWDPESVEVIDGHLFARFTNPHSAFYILTRGQLQRCIESGRYLVGPHRGDHDMLVAAATDPYLECGMRKVISVDEIRDLVVHHLPDRYVGRWGVNEEDFETMVEGLRAVAANELSRQPMIPSLSLDSGEWQRLCHVPMASEIHERVKAGSRVLVVGSGSGFTERQLVKEGCTVTCIPMDSILGQLARGSGVELTDPNLDRAVVSLSGSSFDTIVVEDLVGRVADPPGLLRQLGPLLAGDGELLVSTPNANFYRLARLAGRRDTKLPRRARWQSTGIRPVGLITLGRWVLVSGLQVGPVISSPHRQGRVLSRLPGPLRDLLAPRTTLVVRRGRRS